MGTFREIGQQADKPIIRDWEQVRGDVQNPALRRAIILGDPGFGKSWVLRYEGWRLATHEIERLKQSQVGTAGVQIPLYVKLSDLAKQTGSLLHRLRNVCCDGTKDLPHISELWPTIEAKVSNGDAILFLDGWDEVRNGRKKLKQDIETFVRRNPQCRIFLTSRIAGYERLILGANEWELVAFTPHQIKNFAEQFFDSLPGQEDKAAKLQASLRSDPYVMALAGVPLLLALLCRLFAEKQALPTRRVEIYEQTIDGLLGEWRHSDDEEDKDPTVNEFSVEDKKEILSQLSLKLFLESARVDAWTLSDLEKKLRTVPNGPRTKLKAQRLLTQLIQDGVLIREGEKLGSLVRFIHLTFHEFFAASALAEVANKGGWHGNIAVGKAKYTVEHIIDRKSWDPNWQEVITLVAGRLDDATKLLKLLHDTESEDTLAHRICLAGLCLRDLKPNEVSEQIALDFYDVWRRQRSWRNIDRHLAATSAHTGIIAQLIEQTKDGRTLGRLCLVDSVRVMNRFVDLLGDHDPFVRLDAIAEIRELGTFASEDPRVIECLANLLDDKDSQVRSFATAALGQFAPLSLPNRNKVIARLIESLSDPFIAVRAAAAHTIGKLRWAFVVSSSVTEHLIHLLEDKASYVRMHATEALAELGSIAMTDSKLFDRLLNLLDDADSWVRSTASRALNQMCVGITFTSRLIEHLENSLNSDDSDIRRNAAQAIGFLGHTIAANPRLLDRLIDLLAYDIEEVRSCVAEALATLGPAFAGNSQVIDCLTGLLEDKDWHLRSAAALALGKLGAETLAIRFKLSDRLLPLLDDKVDHVRCCAVSALGHLGRVTTDNPRAIERLIESLGDNGFSVRHFATQALKELRPLIRRNGVAMDRLVSFLSIGNDVLFDRGADLEKLLKKCESAADILEALDVRAFKETSKHYPWKTVEEISKL